MTPAAELAHLREVVAAYDAAVQALYGSMWVPGPRGAVQCGIPPFKRLCIISKRAKLPDWRERIANLDSPESGNSEDCLVSQEAHTKTVRAGAVNTDADLSPSATGGR